MLLIALQAPSISFVVYISTLEAVCKLAGYRLCTYMLHMRESAIHFPCGLPAKRNSNQFSTASALEDCQ